MIIFNSLTSFSPALTESAETTEKALFYHQKKIISEVVMFIFNSLRSFNSVFVFGCLTQKIKGIAYGMNVRNEKRRAIHSFAPDHF